MIAKLTSGLLGLVRGALSITITVLVLIAIVVWAAAYPDVWQGAVADLCNSAAEAAPLIGDKLLDGLKYLLGLIPDQA